MRSDPLPNDVQVNEPTVYAVAGSNPKPWNPPSGLKLHCPMADHKHENIIKEGSENFCESIHGARILPPAPTFDSKTGVHVSCQDKKVCSESSENSIYLMQNLKIGKSDFLTFFDSGSIDSWRRRRNCN